MPEKGPQKISTFGSRVTSTVSVMLVLILSGLAAMLATVTHNIDTGLRNSLGFTVQLRRDVDRADVDALRALMDADRGIESVRLIPADSILAWERQAMGSDLALEAGVNPYCPELEVKIKATHANADSLQAITAAYADMAAVEDIITPAEVIGAVSRNLDSACKVLAVLGAVLLAISIVLINNTVSLSVYSRRFTIHTMRLVGATAGFIRRPFVRAGTCIGLVASAAACAVLCGLRAWAASFEPTLNESLPWSVTAAVCAAIVVFGTAICALTSYFATNRYLAKSYDEMFQK